MPDGMLEFLELGLRAVKIWVGGGGGLAPHFYVMHMSHDLHPGHELS